MKNITLKALCSLSLIFFISCEKADQKDSANPKASQQSEHAGETEADKTKEEKTDETKSQDASEEQFAEADEKSKE
ncbi:MAG: hypothetical protein LBO02_01450 [Holosporaceae bacterium]|nr:hypothetical protein [Holosporaceae bacterium]